MGFICLRYKNGTSRWHNSDCNTDITYFLDPRSMIIIAAYHGLCCVGGVEVILLLSVFNNTQSSFAIVAQA